MSLLSLLEDGVVDFARRCCVFWLNDFVIQLLEDAVVWLDDIVVDVMKLLFR